MKFALQSIAVAFFLACILSGCGKESSSNAQNSEQESTYRAQLDSLRGEQQQLGKRRAGIARQMRELASAAGGEERAKQLPQWAKLEAAAKECDREFSELQKKSTAIVRDHMWQKVNKQ